MNVETVQTFCPLTKCDISLWKYIEKKYKKYRKQLQSCIVGDNSVNVPNFCHKANFHCQISWEI